jgi:hypothetical protein
MATEGFYPQWDWLDKIQTVVAAANLGFQVMEGITEPIATAILTAEIEPSSRNVGAVVSAYMAEGKVPPVDLMAHLISRNETEFPDDKYVTSVAMGALPWLIGGGILLYFLFFRRK